MQWLFSFIAFFMGCQKSDVDANVQKQQINFSESVVPLRFNHPGWLPFSCHVSPGLVPWIGVSTLFGVFCVGWMNPSTTWKPFFLPWCAESFYCAVAQNHKLSRFLSKKQMNAHAYEMPTWLIIMVCKILCHPSSLRHPCLLLFLLILSEDNLAVVTQLCSWLCWLGERDWGLCCWQTWRENHWYLSCWRPSTQTHVFQDVWLLLSLPCCRPHTC